MNPLDEKQQRLSGLREIASRLRSMCDQYGHPDWSTGEFLDAIRDAADSIDLIAASQAPAVTGNARNEQLAAAAFTPTWLELVWMEVQAEIDAEELGERSASRTSPSAACFTASPSSRRIGQKDGKARRK